MTPFLDAKVMTPFNPIFFKCGDRGTFQLEVFASWVPHIDQRQYFSNRLILNTLNFMMPLENASVGCWLVFKWRGTVRGAHIGRLLKRDLRKGK
jgi:hypothetical protein